MNDIYVILGPTCSGKTSVALDLCRLMGGEIISADSRQVYKHMDIGTGKVPSGVHEIIKGDSCWNIDGVNVWGYNLISPGKYFSVIDYANFAFKKIKEILKDGKRAFIVGGTGFYIDVLTGRQQLSEFEPNFVLREQLESKSVEELLSYLKSISSDKVFNIDAKNKVRLIRAIEKELTEKSNNTSPVNLLNNVNFKFIGLNADRSFLFDKVDNWTEWIWKNGLIEEVEGLINNGYKDTHQIKGLIYKDVMDFLDGRKLEQEALQKTKFDLHGYIRRQQTWFKKNDQIKWFDIREKKLSENVQNFVLLS